LSIAWTRQVTVTNIICGVDVSSQWLDARIGADGPFSRLANNAEGVEALAAFCRAHKAELVAMEATGGYEKRSFALLWAHGVSAAIVNPRAVRRFAEGMGLLEKTDKIDAGVIAWYAKVKRIRPHEPAGQTQQRLTALVARLRQLTGLKTAQTNQRRLVEDKTVLDGFEEMLVLILRQIRALESEIAEQIAGDPLWRQLDRAFRSIKGVADRTVAHLMADLPEIGLLSKKAVAKLVGVAPIAKDSGKRNGKRPVRGGRSSVRTILFVVAEVVRRFDPDFAAFHKRMSQAGKAKKVIRIALAHKLLVRLNAKARDIRRQIELTA
jgi:transposase